MCLFASAFLHFCPPLQLVDYYRSTGQLAPYNNQSSDTLEVRLPACLAGWLAATPAVEFGFLLRCMHALASRMHANILFAATAGVTRWRVAGDTSR